MYLNNIYLFGQVRHESVWLCRINYSCVDDVSELCMAAEQDRDLKGDGRGLPTPETQATKSESGDGSVPRQQSRKKSHKFEAITARATGDLAPTKQQFL
jgi:hypothetical protein